jgi:hypothetical protein
LLSVTSDDDLLNEADRDVLVKACLARKIEGGWNVATAKGIELADTLGVLKPNKAEKHEPIADLIEPLAIPAMVKSEPTEIKLSNMAIATSSSDDDDLPF